MNLLEHRENERTVYTVAQPGSIQKQGRTRSEWALIVVFVGGISNCDEVRLRRHC